MRRDSAIKVTQWHKESIPSHQVKSINTFSPSSTTLLICMVFTSLSNLMVNGPAMACVVFNHFAAAQSELMILDLEVCKCDRVLSKFRFDNKNIL
jgi:hypothetical protein